MCKTKRFIRTICSVIICASVLTSGFTSYAETPEERVARHQAMPISTDSVAGWPKGPVVSAESAILIDADTGVILYEKNIHKQQYPASITKILTTLIASEECELDDVVTFSHKAVYDTPYDSNHIAIEENEQLTMEECLKAILIRSANEVSLGIAEHISGGAWEDFADIMNERAKELGALNSHFVNPNGLPNEEHVTTAYDMAMIGRAFFSNEILCNITTTRRLHISPSATQPDDIIEYNQMELIDGGKYEYEYLVGCKTGYTNDARSTLVSCAEKDGMKLICVVMRDEAPYQYQDTISLFDYGFANFQKLNVAENDTKYRMEAGSSFYSENDILGNSKPILSLNTTDYIVLPNSASFADTQSTISYETESDTQAALISYTYQGWDVGTASIDFTGTLESGYEFEAYVEGEIAEDTGTKNDAAASETNETPEENRQQTDETAKTSIFSKIGKVLLYALFIVLALAAVTLVILFIRRYIIIRQRRNRNRHRARTLRPSNDPYAMVNRDSYRRSQIADAKRRQRAAEAKRRNKRRTARWR